MPTFLSPGVFTRETDISVAPTAQGPLRPVFIGTANKGPVNKPTFVATAQEAIDIFGEPFPESYLMYAVLAYMEEGNQAYIVRVGVTCEESQASELDDICIDMSGNRVSGWGRIPLFTGIDYGRLNLRLIDTDHPLVIHDAAVTNIDYNDQDLSSTDGPTTATLVFTGQPGVSDAYIGDVDDSFIVLITDDPDPTESMHGAKFEIIRNSDNAIVATGTISDNGLGYSQAIGIGDGLSLMINVSSGRLETNDTFTFLVRPDNRKFAVSVEGATATEFTMSAATFTTVTSFVTALNLLIGGGEDYLAIEYTADNGDIIPQFRTRTAGRRIQLLSSAAWAIELGTALYAWDIPRSYLIGTDAGPFTLSSNNNRVRMQVIPPDDETVDIEFTLANGTNLTSADVANLLDLSGVISGTTYFDSFALTVPGGTSHIVIVTTIDRRFDQLKLLANFSNLKTLRFTEEVGITNPFTRSYRGFSDNRVSLPTTGENDPEVPLSCELDALSATCASDTAYFGSIVGWLVSTSPGTWIDDYKVNVELQTNIAGDPAGRYQITIRDKNNAVVDIIQDVSFDPRVDRFIANVINPGTTYGGTAGNPYVNWEERPSFLNNDPLDTANFEVRQPAQIFSAEFAGTANGIPTDPAFSSELDAAVIGNQAESTGIYSVSNAETYDTNLLVIPGFTSGAVIGQGLQLCESRGDMLFIVDPPFGLRPQQVVDWHNGMLLSDVARAINSSYGALYWGWMRTFDQFNELEIWVPPSGHVAGVFARTARDTEQWFPPAGLRRGRLITPLEVEFNPALGERDLLYGSGNAVNPIVSFPQDGIVVFGQRTLQRRETALSRVNVRMLLIYLKKNLTRILRDFVFEPNDSTTWAQVRSALNPFLADIQARRGLDGYRVVCDESTNTPARRDRNELHVVVFLKPTKAIEFIALNLVVLSSSASFTSEEVLAAAGIVSRDNGIVPSA